MDCKLVVNFFNWADLVDKAIGKIINYIFKVKESSVCSLNFLIG